MHLTVEPPSDSRLEATTILVTRLRDTPETAWVAVRALPDLWTRQTVTGEIVRARRYRQWAKSGDNPKYWYYLAVDDGSDASVVAWRVRSDIWSAHAQGQTVVAEITPRLRYVRSISRA